MLSPSIRESRGLRALGVLVLALLLGACGGSGGSAGSSAAGGAGSGDGPDTSAVQQKFLDNVNLSAEGMARFTAFKESGRKSDGEGDMQGCVVSFAGELEFTGACEYNGVARKAGDRVIIEAEIEYIKDRSGWKQVSSGFYPH